MAKRQITKFGMSKRIGLVAFPDGGNGEFPSADHLYSTDTVRLDALLFSLAHCAKQSGFARLALLMKK